MRLKEKELIYRYFNSQLTLAEEELREIQQRVRFRRIDVTDSYELQNAAVKYETMKQISSDILLLLNMGDCNNDM